VRIRTDDGLELEVREQGGGPALILVHGFGGAKEDFAPHLDSLAADHRVITLDLRGHGESDGPDDPARYSLDRFAADLHSVLDALEVASGRFLGHSMGGMIVRRFVLAHPERVDALVFMDTSPGAPPGLDREIIELGVQIANEQGMDELKRVMDAFGPLDTPSYLRMLEEDPGYREFGDAKWATLSRGMYTAMMVENCDQPDQLAALDAVTCPTMVLVGEEDERFLGVSRQMSEQIAGAEFVVIPAAGHSPQFENPTAWITAVQAFLARLAVAPTAV